MLDILLQHLNLLGLQLTLLFRRVILYEGITDFAAGREDGILPIVIRLFVLCLSHTQTSYQLSVLEDRLHQAGYCRPQHLSWVHDGASVIGKRTGTADGDIRIETAACQLDVIEALCQIHFLCMYVRTVVEQLYADACSKLLGQILVVEGAAGDTMCRFTQQQTQ